MLSLVSLSATIYRMGRPLCAGNRAYTDPNHRDAHQAIAACHHCPLIRQCAADALRAGDSLDGSMRAPATGVIAAGVICTGDQHTAAQLAQIAHVPAPQPRARRTRMRRPDNCLGCGRPMTVRPRGDGVHLTPDIVTHCAHGYCRDCDKQRRRSGEITPTRTHTRDLLERAA